MSFKIFEMPPPAREMDVTTNTVKIIKRYQAELTGGEPTPASRAQAGSAVITAAGSVLVAEGVFLNSIVCKRHHGRLYDFELKYLSPDHPEEENGSPGAPRHTVYDPPQVTFTTVGEKQHLTHARETLSTWSFHQDRTGAEVPVPDYGDAIGVADGKIGGVDVVIPKLEFTETWRIPKTLVTPSYIKFLADNTGKMNNKKWRTFEPGELLFLGTAGSQTWRKMPATEGNPWGMTLTDWKISYSFRCSPTEKIKVTQSRSTPTLTAVVSESEVEKPGFAHAWMVWKDTLHGQDFAKRPKFLIVNRIYDDFDFSELGIDAPPPMPSN